MGAHTYGLPKVQNTLFPYTWTGHATNAFNNDYYRNLVGQDKWFVDDETCFLVGDAYGNKPKTRWLAHSRKFKTNGGPVFWIHQNNVCPSVKNDIFWGKKQRRRCMDKTPKEPAGMHCKPDRPPGGKVYRKPDEPDADPDRGCEQWRLIIGKDEIALNCEMGLYLDFQVTDGVPHGCPGLEHFNASMASDEKRGVWSHLPGERRLSQPLCGKQKIAEPPGSTPVSEIMEEYANDQATWINDYILVFEKMMRNGYPNGLSDGPDYHTDVICPLPFRIGYPDGKCYKKDEYDPNGVTYTITNQWYKNVGLVYQYNPSTDRCDFGPSNGQPNQRWWISKSGKQIINTMTGIALVVKGVANFEMENIDEYTLLIDPVTKKTLSGFFASIPEKECGFYDRNGGESERFVFTPSS